MISLEEKCKLNCKAFADTVKRRLMFLFMYLNLKQNKKYDYKDIKLKFTPNVPQDDVSAAQIITNLGDKISLETALSLLSFIDNPTLEAKKAKKEQQESMEDIPHDHTDNLDNSNTDNLNKDNSNSGDNNAK